MDTGKFMKTCLILEKYKWMLLINITDKYVYIYLFCYTLYVLYIFICIFHICIYIYGKIILLLEVATK